MKKDMIVIKFYEQLALKVPGIPDSYTQWAVVSAGKDAAGGDKLKIKRVDHREAMRIVRENGLVETLRNRDGVVFDTPKASFREEHHGAPIPCIG